VGLSVSGKIRKLAVSASKILGYQEFITGTGKIIKKWNNVYIIYIIHEVIAEKQHHFVYVVDVHNSHHWLLSQGPRSCYLCQV
jgi:hypothetical protein